MGLLTKTGAFTTPTTTGNFDVTGLGFQPTGIIAYHESGPDTVALTSHLSFADAAGNQVSNFTIATGRDAANAARRSTSNKFISRAASNGVVNSEATVSMLADGFRLNFTTANSSLNFRYIAFKDVPINVGMFTASTATSASGSVTGMSFKPAAMVGMWLAGTGTASSALGYGLVDSALKQYSSAGNNNSGTGSLYASEANFVSVYSPTGYAGRMMVTSLNNDGFSYLTGATGSAFDYGYFAIGGVISNLVDVLAPSASSVAYTGVGFKPQTLINNFVYTDGTTQNAYTNSWGIAQSTGFATDDLTQGYMTNVGMNGASNTNVRYYTTAKGFGRTPFGSPSTTPYIEGQLTSYDPDGFSITWTNTEAANGIWKTLALAPAPTATTIDQTSNARIQRTETKDQTANARIQTVNAKTQSGNARITNIVTRSQGANARIQVSVLRTQSGNARIQVSTTRNQPANATISQQVTREQTAAALIREASIQRQYGDARITATALRNQSAIASILNSVIRSQPANARIQLITTKNQNGNASIAATYTKTQLGNARILASILRQQLGNARITRIEVQSQLANAVISKELLVTQTGNARIVKGIDYTIKPVIQIDKEIPLVGSYTIRPDGRAESITRIVTSDKIKQILNVENPRDDLVIRIDAVNVG